MPKRFRSLSRARGRPLNKYARIGGLAAGTAFRAYRSFTRSGTRTKRGAAPAPITGESDWRSTYKRRRMPVGRRKRWVRFVRRVKAVVEKQVSPQFNVLLRQIQATTVDQRQAAISIHTVLGANGQGSNQGTMDLSYLFDRAFVLADTSGVTGPAKEQMRIHITGWMIETSIRNFGLNTTYIDCYYWRTKRDVKTGESSATLFEDSVAQVAQNDTGGVDMTSALYGVTPFQGVLFAKHCQIWKKTRVKIAPGGTLQLEQRSGRNYYRTWAYDQDYSMLRGVTEGILFVQYGAPGNTPGVDDQASATAISYSTNANYTWRIVQDNRLTGALRDV
ncbi:MAG: putative capsid protein [Cressdnaviricota sp.]|nr:MAG: putative capsid protein [Cressdnaviricota sp.]